MICVPLPVFTVAGGGTIPPYLGWQSSVWAEVGNEARLGAALFCLLGTFQWPRYLAQAVHRRSIQRLPALSFKGLEAPWLGIAGELLSVGFEARQSGFIQRYGLIFGRRIIDRTGGEEASIASSGVLVDWLGSWKRRQWTFTTRWVLDSESLTPAVVSGSYLFRDQRGRERFRVAYQRRDLGRDLTLDLDPALGPLTSSGNGRAK